MGPDERYPAFVVAVLGDTGTAIAYSEHGFGLARGGLVFLESLRSGMDSGWFARLEDAFRDSWAWDEPVPGDGAL